VYTTFEVLLAVLMKTQYFWDLAPGRLVKIYRHLKGEYFRP
jgi:hypothetical protein